MQRSFTVSDGCCGPLQMLCLAATTVTVRFWRGNQHDYALECQTDLKHGLIRSYSTPHADHTFGVALAIWV